VKRSQNENKSPEKAREYAFLLLKFRLRSSRELADRLSRKKFPAGVTRQVVSFLEEKGFLDDKAFTKAWIASRAAKRFGARRIRQELVRKGIAGELIEEGLRELGERRSEEETVREVAGEKFRKLKDVDPRTAKRRIYAYFLRRGFSPETVIDILNGLE
jgi:regulatory protein